MGLKVMLINPPVRTWAPPNCFPLGLAYLASTLQKEDVGVLDINALRLSKETVELTISELECDVIGIGGIITTFEYVQWLCEIIKKYYPKTFVVVGGAVATSIPEIILNETQADVAVLGEGEMTFFKLCMAIKYRVSPFEIPGIAFKGQKIIYTEAVKPMDLSQLPTPPWSLFPIRTYLENPIGYANSRKWVDGQGDGTLTMNMSATRGCPYNCIYCYHDFMGAKYRTRPAYKVADEMKELFKRYAVEYVHFVDDEFCLNKEFVYELCEHLIRSGLNNVVKWGCTGRVNLANEFLYKTMKTAGCVQVCYGIESGSQRMLDVMRKGVKVEQAIEALEMTNRIFGNNDFSMMVGMLGETKETLQESVEFVKKVGKPTACFFVTPYPGTRLFEIAKEKGLIKNELEYIKSLSEQGKQITLNLTELPDDLLFKYKSLIESAG